MIANEGDEKPDDGENQTRIRGVSRFLIVGPRHMLGAVLRTWLFILWNFQVERVSMLISDSFWPRCKMVSSFICLWCQCVKMSYDTGRNYNLGARAIDVHIRLGDLPR